MLQIPTPPTPKNAKALRNDTDGAKKKVLQSVYMCDDADAMSRWQSAVADAKNRGLRSANAFAAYAIDLVAEHDAVNALANIVDAVEWFAANDADALRADAKAAHDASDDADYRAELLAFMDAVNDAEREARAQIDNGVERVRDYLLLASLAGIRAEDGHGDASGDGA